MFIEVDNPRRLINVDSLKSFEFQPGRIVAYRMDGPHPIVVKQSTNNAELEMYWKSLVSRLVDHS